LLENLSKELDIEEDAKKLCCHQNLFIIVEHKQREHAHEGNNNKHTFQRLDGHG